MLDNKFFLKTPLKDFQDVDVNLKGQYKAFKFKMPLKVWRMKEEKTIFLAGIERFEEFCLDCLTFRFQEKE